METQISNSPATPYEAAVTKKSASPISTEGKISKMALITFLSCATLVFAIAIYYCSTTNHVAQAEILTAGLVLIYFFAANIYKSFK
jgi:hypothetical protein